MMVDAIGALLIKNLETEDVNVGLDITELVNFVKVYVLLTTN